ncbi:uncharacterized protein LOC126666918 [Mercurialis annua]|uniref:uncharacterized protein LOC126666918 n=1 Tax=Mercurialis annua TaxID=3986 RepID=UPI0021605418|nr:uncharacterized protein LOC126666918 [Mercurialis annua]
MVAASPVLPINGLLSQYPSHSATILKWGFRCDKDSGSSSRTNSQAFRILATSNVSGTRSSKKEVIMVDPSEAKRLAAKQMKEIQAKEKFKRRRRIEAINGAWAMIGLTAGLVIEGRTGKSIMDQLAGYMFAIVHFFLR